MKKYMFGIVMTLGVFITLSVLLYPTVSDYLNSRSQSRVVARYFDDVVHMDDEKPQRLLKAAREYNRKLLKNNYRFKFTEQETTEYRSLLNTGGDVMGVLVIDKINVKLPIYHGTDEGVLHAGVGHIQGSSLPVGGTGTHSFITGHRGLPSATLLSNLNKMAEGDIFILYVLGETLTYQVDQIQTVEPHEVETLAIDPDMDYCTLVTCTPYGVNSHRLLVRGQRVENADTADWNSIYAGAKRLDKLIIILIFTVPVLPVLIIYIMFKCVKIRKGGKIQCLNGLYPFYSP